MGNEPTRGVLDTCTFVDLTSLKPELLPAIPELTAVTFAELHQGIPMAKTALIRASRLERLNAATAYFDPLPFTGEAASRYGTLAALLLDMGRSPKPRRLDLMIAAISSIHELPLYTRNPSDFIGLESMVHIVHVLSQ